MSAGDGGPSGRGRRDEVATTSQRTERRRNAGGRSVRDRARTAVPFEPANALGNRVLSPASRTPTGGRASRAPIGLAELEHPRTCDERRETSAE
jgi:hypothetical protein